MNRKLNLGLSLAAGLLGGILSHYIKPQLVLAQSQTVPPKEIVAQRFVLVNDKGLPAGFFGFDSDGNASLALLDATGKIIWSENGKPKAHPLGTDIVK